MSNPSPSIRAQVLSRTGGRCAYMGTLDRCPNVATEIHHRKLRKQGGSDDVENLLPLCLTHHAIVHRYPEDSYGEGWLIHAWEDESPWPERWYR